MKRIALATTALGLLLVPTAGADRGVPDAAASRRPHRELLVRGTALSVSPISVRASIGSIVTCEVRNRALVADLEVGDHVRMKCVRFEARWILRRLAIAPSAPPAEVTGERAIRAGVEVPAVPTPHELPRNGS